MKLQKCASPACFLCFSNNVRQRIENRLWRKILISRSRIHTPLAQFSLRELSSTCAMCLSAPYNARPRCRGSSALCRSPWFLCLGRRGGCRRTRHRGWPVSITAQASSLKCMEGMYGATTRSPPTWGGCVKTVTPFLSCPKVFVPLGQ